MSGVSNPTDISPLVDATDALHQVTKRVETLTRVLIGIAAVQAFIAIAALIVAS
ncbi:MAG: hypothetical protein AABM43_12155 [Actinomycetota bacterium]